MAAEVFYVPVKPRNKQSLQTLLARLLDSLDLSRICGERDLVAVKTHIGEMGNAAYIRPPYLAVVVDALHKLRAKPFLTDSTSLYTGRRQNGLDMVETAARHGFTREVVGAPFLPADGLKGDDILEVPSPIEGNPPVQLAGLLARADALVCVSHFKGHDLTGMGGAIKNLSMGGSAKAGKFYMHVRSKPFVNAETCIGCRRCLPWCAWEAIGIEDGTAVIDEERCTGCAHCLLACPVQAIGFRWDGASDEVQRRMGEYAAALVAALDKRAVYLNFILDVSPSCDCFPRHDPSIVPDLGIVGGYDPIAVDAASRELVRRAPALPGSAAAEADAGEDKFTHLYPQVDPGVQLRAAAELGLGSIDFDLKTP